MVVYKELKVKPGKKVKLSDFPTDYTGEYKSRRKAEADLPAYLERMEELRYKMYSDNRYGYLYVLQGIDAAGKDGVCRHVMGGFNPQGVHVKGFKAPSQEELDHDYLWRIHKEVPNLGSIGIFNRSHYEDVLVVRVKGLAPEKVWKRRYDEINAWEKYLYDNNIRTVKFFLHISKKEQSERFLKRLLDARKNWKFSIQDLRESERWNDYQEAFEDMLNKTSTKYAPWYIVPADKKWFRNICIAKVIVDSLEDLDIDWPKPSKEVLDFVKKARATGKLPPLPK